MRIVVISLCLCLLSLLAWSNTSVPPPPPPPSPGASLAAMSLCDLNGKAHAMSEVKSKRVLVVFWAFWCDTWRAALPHLQELQGRCAELDSTIWTVSIDGTYTAEVRPLVADGKIPFPVLLDNGAWQSKLGLRRVPTVLLLDSKRTAVKIYEGYPGNDILISELRQVK